MEISSQIQKPGNIFTVLNNTSNVNQAEQHFHKTKGSEFKCIFEFCSNELTTFNVKQWSVNYWNIKAVVSLIFSISRLLWTFCIAAKVWIGQFCRVLNELPYVLGVTYSLGFKPLAFFFPRVLQPNKKILSTVSSHKSVVWCDNGNQTLWN